MTTKTKSWVLRRRILFVTGALTTVAAFLSYGFDMMPRGSLSAFPLSAISALVHDVMYFYSHFYVLGGGVVFGSGVGALSNRLPKRWWITLPLWGAAWFVFPPLADLTYIIANAADNLVQGWWIGIAIDWLIMQPVFWLAWSLIKGTGPLAWSLIKGAGFLLRNIRTAPRVIYGECRSLFTRGKHRRRRFVKGAVTRPSYY
jgi:hypothetical protein